MFLLNDHMIRTFINEKEIGIKHLDEKLLNPTWYNFRVGFVSLWDKQKKPPGFGPWTELEETGQKAVIPPRGYASIRSFESFTLSKKVLGMFSQTSRLALKGLRLNHSLTIDPGFDGVLEIGVENLLDEDRVLPFGDVIGKLIFFCVSDTYPVGDPVGETANRFQERRVWSDPDRVKRRLEDVVIRTD